MCSKQTETDFTNKWSYNWIIYSIFINIYVWAEFTKAIDVRLMQSVHISIFMFYASIEET